MGSGAPGTTGLYPALEDARFCALLNNRSRRCDCAVREKALPWARNPFIDQSKSLLLRCKPISSPASGEMGTAAGCLLTLPLWPGLVRLYCPCTTLWTTLDKFLTNCWFVPQLSLPTIFSRFSFCYASRDLDSGDSDTKAPGLRSIS